MKNFRIIDVAKSEVKALAVTGNIIVDEQRLREVEEEMIEEKLQKVEKGMTKEKIQEAEEGMIEQQHREVEGEMIG